MGFIEIDNEKPNYDHDPNIYLKKNPKLFHEPNPYTKELYLDIYQEIDGREIVIGELNGHFFNLSKLCNDRKIENIFPLIHQYDEETFDICNCLIKETTCYKKRGKNIYHLDRFFIYPEYRGSGIGRSVLESFEKNIKLFLENNVGYIGLFPDPITENLEYDSSESMNKEQRDEAVRHLKDFYLSLGFINMKTNPNYMYLDLNNLSIYKKQIS